MKASSTSSQVLPTASREEPAGAGSFERRYEVRWADLDANRHMRNTAYSEYASHTRVSFLAAHGFSPARFAALRFGPVLFREEIRFRREVHLEEIITVNVRCGGLAPDGSRWRMYQEITCSDGQVAALVTVEGAWMDLDVRRLVPPPPELLGALQALPHTEDYEILPSLRKPQ